MEIVLTIGQITVKFDTLLSNTETTYLNYV